MVLPISLAAQAPVAGSGQITPLKPGIWIYTYNMMYQGNPVPCNGMIVQIPHGYFLVDTPPDTNSSKKLFAWCDSTFHQYPLGIFITHAHDDRIGGAQFFLDRKVTVLSTKLTAQIAKQKGLPIPNPLLHDTSSEVNLNGKIVNIFWPGAGHSPDNVIIWLKQDSVLFGGCAVKSMEATDLGNVADADIPSWKNAMKLLESRYADAMYVVPGHGAIATKAALSHTELLIDAALRKKGKH